MMKISATHFHSCFLLASVLLLSACGGSFGTLAWRSWDDHGSQITEVRTVGLEIRNLSSFHGIAVGKRHTLYGTSSFDSMPAAPESLPWRFGWCPAPEAPILLLSQRTFGIEASHEPTFVGLGIGVNTRTVTHMPIDSDIIIVSSINHDQPEQTRIEITSP